MYISQSSLVNQNLIKCLVASGCNSEYQVISGGFNFSQLLAYIGFEKFF